MGWSLNWASSYESDIRVELGYSGSAAQTRAWVEPMLDQLPPVAARNARAMASSFRSAATTNTTTHEPDGVATDVGAGP
jgi:hypothetical protein